MPKFEIGIKNIIADVPQEVLMRADLYEKFIWELKAICQKEECELKFVDECFDPKNFRYTFRLEKIYKGEK